jgi:cation:H+ antiporter
MRNWVLIIAAIISTLPGLVAVFSGAHLDTKAPIIGGLILGLAVFGAAFLLSWAVESAQKEVPAALALSVLALIAVLPEYAVDISLTIQAATNPAYEELAVANMIGANRMLVGFAWPLIIFLFWLRFGKREIILGKSQRVEVGFLGLAGLYSLIIPLKGQLDIIDVVILFGLFILYAVRIARSEVVEPELEGPAETIGSLPVLPRRLVLGALLIWATFVIFNVAEPFAESLINTGKAIGVDEVFMVQWFAPIASEAPEIIVCILFTLKGLASAGLGALVASKVNQWTLLVGSLPLVFSIASGRIRPLPLNADQVGSMFVTSGQTLLAVAIMLNLSVSLWEGGVLFGLFVAQFFFPERFPGLNIDAHYVFGVIYLVLAIVLLIRLPKGDYLQTFQTMFNFRRNNDETPLAERDKQVVNAEKESKS